MLWNEKLASAAAAAAAGVMPKQFYFYFTFAIEWYFKSRHGMSIWLIGDWTWFGSLSFIRLDTLSRNCVNYVKEATIVLLANKNKNRGFLIKFQPTYLGT